MSFRKRLHSLLKTLHHPLCLWHAHEDNFVNYMVSLPNCLNFIVLVETYDNTRKWLTIVIILSIITDGLQLDWAVKTFPCAFTATHPFIILHDTRPIAWAVSRASRQCAVTTIPSSHADAGAIFTLTVFFTPRKVKMDFIYITYYRRQ